MPIAKHHKINFDTLECALNAGRLALLEVMNAKDHTLHVAIVAVNDEESGGNSFTPLAIMIDGNPFDDYFPPSPTGGFITHDGTIIPSPPKRKLPKMKD